MSRVGITANTKTVIYKNLTRVKRKRKRKRKRKGKRKKKKKKRDGGWEKIAQFQSNSTRRVARTGS